MRNIFLFFFILGLSVNLRSQQLCILLNDNISRTEVNFEIFDSLSNNYLIIESLFCQDSDFKSRMRFWASIFDDKKWFVAESASLVTVRPFNSNTKSKIEDSLSSIEIESVRFFNHKDYVDAKSRVKNFRKKNLIIHKNEWVSPCSFAFIFDEQKTVYIIYTTESNPEGEGFQNILSIIKKCLDSSVLYNFYNWDEIIEIKK